MICEGRSWSRTLGLLVPLCVATNTLAAPTERTPPPLKKVSLTPHPGAELPLSLPLRDAQEHPVQLKRYFKQQRPVLLTLAYLDCSMLCNLVVRHVGDVARQMTLMPGSDYRLVTVAIDPTETGKQAQEKQRSLRKAIEREADDPAWTYLRGSKESIQRLADTLGFGFVRDPRTKQYAHPAAAFVVDAQGRLATTFQGLGYSANAMQRALESAGRGDVKAPSIAGQVLRCFRFDPALRQHQARIRRLFSMGALIVFGGLASLVGVLVILERRRS